MKCYYKFYSAFLNGQLLLPGVARTPKLISYYAANLNSDMPTVKSANPNALLFAFKNWPLPRTNWTNSISLYTSVDPSSPPEGIT